VAARSEAEAAPWDELVASLPPDTTLAEVRDYVWADNSEQQRTLLVKVHVRLGLPPPIGLPEVGVRVMTMHGAKGLQASVAFVPGLEDEVLPGARRAGVPGLLLEGARLLYMSITRARTVVVLSFAGRRFVSGAMATQTPSRYCAHLAGPFASRTTGLTAGEVGAVVGAIAAMQAPSPPDE
jgi:hypothetical protein